MLRLKNENRGITLIALVVTIIVLIILASISINLLFGNNGIITKAREAKSSAAIAEEREKIELAYMGDIAGTGEFDYDEFIEELHKNLNQNANAIEIGENEYIIGNPDTDRAFKIEGGKCTYIGKLSELSDMIVISVDRENGENLSIGGVTINANLITLNEANDSDIGLEYGWSSSNTVEPSSYQTATLNKESEFKRTAELETRVGEAGNYYLWLKAKLKNKDIQKTYGVYEFKELSMLVKAETSVYYGSKFLNNSFGIERQKIKSIEIVRGIDGYNQADGYWDVSAQKNGEILAWYKQDGDYYNVWIGAKDAGKIVANENGYELFAYIGTSQYSYIEAKIDGLTNLDTSYMTRMDGMFYQSRGIKKLDLSTFDTRNVTTMKDMFYRCADLQELNLSSFNTSKVINMENLFLNCENIERLDLRHFDTSNVTNMSQMFYCCYNLTELNISNFNTRKVTNIHEMFQRCSNLRELNLNSFDTSLITKMNGIFYGCENLIILNINNFNTSNVTDMSNMFYNCKKLSQLNVSSFDTRKVVNMYRMFSGCESLTSLNVDNFNTSSVTNMSDMFYGCKLLTTLSLDNFNTSNVTNMLGMFCNCESLTSLDLKSFDTEGVTLMSRMFSGCKSLQSINLSSFNTTSVTSMMGMFERCEKIQNLNLGNFDTSNVTDMNNMFYGCSLLNEINISNFNTENVTDMQFMFQGCSALTDLDLSGFKTNKVTGCDQMFMQCSNLITIYVSDSFDVTSVSWAPYMFSSCEALVGGNGTTFSIYHSGKEYARIDTAETPGYFTLKTN